MKKTFVLISLFISAVAAFAQPQLNKDNIDEVVKAMTLEEKVRVWQAISKPYQISLFYKAAPVMLSSEIVINPPRVSQASFEIDLMGRERRENG